MGNGIKIALFISLALNVFAVGLISGKKIYGADTQPNIEARGPSTDPMRMMRHTRALPPESREAFREILRPNLAELRERRGVVRERQRAYFEALHAAEWDRDQVEVAQRELELARAEFSAFANEVFLDAMEQLGPEG
ncbi:MAG: periplasmic heavy metal sensor, partial [Marinicaulis sp.]|nr:periplasmic heavy metal sensor [Marinicaulis sp.]